jgi:hypothetical protein
MFETGLFSVGDIAEKAPRLTRASAKQTHSRPGLKKRLCGGIAACAFMLTFIAPVSIDFTNGKIAVNAALAGNGAGNYGNGKGNGGPNRQNPGNGNGGDDDDDDDDDDSPDDDPDPDPDTGEGDGDASSRLVTEDGGGDSGTDNAAGMADADFGAAIDAVAGSPAEGPMAGTPATALPTISQLFSMGDEAAVSTEDELELIANGWGAAN